MSVYSTNQARHLYVVTESSDISVGKDAEGSVFLSVKGYDGKFLRSDLMANLISAKATSADKLKRELNAVEVTGTPTAAGTYTLGITYRQWMAASDETFYHEWASAKYDGSSVSNFYRDLAINLAKNTEKQGMVCVKLINSSDAKVDVTASTKASALTATYKALVVMEIEQPWVLGTTPQTVVYVEKDNVIAPWATVTDLATATYVTDGKEIADLEYFCLGERGDQYRNVGWPYVTPTKGKVDATKQYDIIDIHYAYVGANEGVQKSEKTVTLAILTDGSTHTLTNSVASAINSETGATAGTATYINSL